MTNDQASSLTGNKETAASRYKKLSSDRQPYIDRADEAARYTLPMYHSKFNDNKNGGAKIEQPWQSLGAQGVNNIASKLLLTMIPPNLPFFKHMVDDTTLVKADQEEIKSDIEQSLGKYDRAIHKHIEAAGDRKTLFEFFKRLLISGNGLVLVLNDSVKLFPLSNYVVVRDDMGNDLEIIIEEDTALEMLPESTRAAVEKQRATVVSGTKNDKNATPKNDKAARDLKIYTRIHRTDPDTFEIYQEVNETLVEGSEGVYKVDSTPWIAARFYEVPGEDYGRGYVSEYLGDLKSLEALSRATIESAAIASRHVNLVNPTGLTKLDDVVNAPNGSAVAGREEDVGTLSLGNLSDLRIVDSRVAEIAARLEKAFLLNTSIQRPGERVTAQEIRYMARQLEDQLGGIYSIQAEEFQLPYVAARRHLLEEAGKLPELPKDIVLPAIITGFDALGRGHQRDVLISFIGTVAETLGPEAALTYINPSEFISRLATSDGIDKEGLIRDEEEIQANKQQEMMAAMAQQLGPEALKQMGAAAQQPQPTPPTQ